MVAGSAFILAAVNGMVNFAFHFPLLDRLFGTYHLPKEKWPEGYSIGGHIVPPRYLVQFKYPFKREKPVE
jgi:sterol desaturase/sphingolipid hydroxylase (fatty acid hydroxylase superfamily)